MNPGLARLTASIFLPSFLQVAAQTLNRNIQNRCDGPRWMHACASIRFGRRSRPLRGNALLRRRGPCAQNHATAAGLGSRDFNVFSHMPPSTAYRVAGMCPIVASKSSDCITCQGNDKILAVCSARSQASTSSSSGPRKIGSSDECVFSGIMWLTENTQSLTCLRQHNN
jgi:hypothetical protein